MTLTWRIFCISAVLCAVMLFAPAPRLRSAPGRMLANCIWTIAVDYHHSEPSMELARRFPPVTAARLELIPPLRLVLRLDPSNREARLLLAQILVSTAGLEDEGMDLLEEGTKTPGAADSAHIFLGAMALSSLESHRRNPQRPFDSARLLAWLEEALRLAPPSPASPTITDVYHPARYHQLIAVVLLEQGERDKAIAAWEKSGESLASSTDLVAIYLQRYRSGLPVPAHPRDLDFGTSTGSPSTEIATGKGYDFEHQEPDQVARENLHAAQILLLSLVIVVSQLFRRRNPSAGSAR